MVFLRNGGWTPWSSWGQCSTSCEIGFEVRQRSCNNPSPRHGGRVCVGQAREQRWETDKVECSRPLHYTLIWIQSGKYSAARGHWWNKTFFILYTSRHLNYSVKPMMQLCISHYTNPFSAVFSIQFPLMLNCYVNVFEVIILWFVLCFVQ